MGAALLVHQLRCVRVFAPFSRTTFFVCTPVSKPKKMEQTAPPFETRSSESGTVNATIDWPVRVMSDDQPDPMSWPGVHR